MEKDSLVVNKKDNNKSGVPKCYLAAFYIYSFVGIFSGLFGIFVNGTAIKTGKLAIYFILACFLFFVFSSLAYIILFFTKLRKEKCEKRYRSGTIGLLVVILLLLYLYIPSGKEYVYDFLSGTETVLVNEYRITQRNYFEFTDNENNECRVRLPENIAEKIVTDNPQIDGLIDDFYRVVYTHDFDVEIKYYPNTKLLYSIKILD